MQHVSLEEVAVVGGDRATDPAGDIVALDDALSVLARLDPRKVQVVEQLDYNLLFRWFVGLEMDEPVWESRGLFPGEVRGSAW